MIEIKFGRNSLNEENQSQLKNERSHLETKFLDARKREILSSISYGDLINLKFGNEWETMEVFLKSERTILKSNCNNLMKFLGVFYLITHWGSTAKSALKMRTLPNPEFLE